MQTTILPEATIGIIGGGQLARYLTISAQNMGYRVAILEPDHQAPGVNYANFYLAANYTDLKALTKLQELSTVITCEFENVPSSALEFLAQKKPVYPNTQSFKIAQNRLQEKELCNKLHIKTVDYLPINLAADIQNTPKNFYPAILKTNTLGYDGKGQVRVSNQLELEQAFKALNQVPCILEKMIHLKAEVSLLSAKNAKGLVFYPLIENTHQNGILKLSLLPSKFNNDAILTQQAQAISQKINQALDYIGLLSIEFFITENNELLVNELAPRVHNSGHITMDSSLTSQFENHIRAITNLSLGSTQTIMPGAMINLLGGEEITYSGAMDNYLNQYPDTKLYWYNKAIIQKNRKLGHLNLLNPDQLTINKLLTTNLIKNHAKNE